MSPIIMPPATSQPISVCLWAMIMSASKPPSQFCQLYRIGPMHLHPTGACNSIADKCRGSISPRRSCEPSHSRVQHRQKRKKCNASHAAPASIIEVKMRQHAKSPSQVATGSQIPQAGACFDIFRYPETETTVERPLLKTVMCRFLRPACC